jgi:hypothetical protein
MRRFAYVFALMLSISWANPLSAQDPTSPSLARRQLAECMSRRMSANHLLSYNDAAKACKDQLKNRKDTAANVSPKPVS